MRIGFIGTGSMGGMLIKAFVRSGQNHLEIAAYNRTPFKLDQIINHYPAIRKMNSAYSLAKSCDTLFLCVKPGDVKPLFDEICTSLTPDQILISINSAWSLAELEKITPCKVIKIIPSITQEALSGVILTMYGSRITPEDHTKFHNFFRTISFPVNIKEADIRVSADLTSCGPAFLSSVLQFFSNAAVQQGGIQQSQADQMVKYMIYGLAKLLVEEGYSFEEIISRVSVPGGITAEGLKVLQPVENIFNDVLITTSKKHKHHAKH